MAGVFLAGCRNAPFTPSYYGSTDAVAAIKGLLIPTGPYAGGYEVAPNGKMNWYFANLGLVSVVQHMSNAELATYILPYLDLYIASLKADFAVDDVLFPEGRANTSNTSLTPSDSDDSYAATFLSLVKRYVQATNNVDWLAANLSDLEQIAYHNLIDNTKASGLTSTFQYPRRTDYDVGFLMDNCEVYRGLKDFAYLLSAGTTKTDVNACADQIAIAIKNVLWVASGVAYKAADITVDVETVFYAGTTCQVFAELFGVSPEFGHFTQAFAYLNAHSPVWEGGSYDSYPWAMLGTAAALRGQTAQAHTQIDYIDGLFISSPAFVTINELGFYRQTQSVLAGLKRV